jgi:hypothetical protein
MIYMYRTMNFGDTKLVLLKFIIRYTHCHLKFGFIFCNEKGDRSRIKLESPFQGDFSLKRIPKFKV